jgi:hypothetical protein
MNREEEEGDFCIVYRPAIRILGRDYSLGSGIKKLEARQAFYYMLIIKLTT